MMTAIVQETPASTVLPSVLLIGRKHAVEYIAPALFRLNSTGELVIKATGSLTIVTAVNVAELVKRNVGNLVTKSITVGTDELAANGMSRRMSCIEICLAKKIIPMPVVVAPAAIEVAPVQAAVPANKRARKKSSTAKKKKETGSKKRKPMD